MKILVIVDMQNDFLTGNLANKKACKIVPKIVELAKDYDHLFFTRDSHDSNYLNTAEGKALPIKHCIKGTNGWEIVEELVSLNPNTVCFDKETFGSIELAECLSTMKNLDEVTFCGTCTDICVISNVLLLKTYTPELKINVKADCCAGSSEFKHEAALAVMQSCQINII